MIPDVPNDNHVPITIAIGGLMSPLWLHTLSDLSQLWLPILGAAYLLLQAGVFIYKTFIRKPKA
jgi:hypothetical protein